MQLSVKTNLKWNFEVHNLLIFMKFQQKSVDLNTRKVESQSNHEIRGFKLRIYRKRTLNFQFYFNIIEYSPSKRIKIFKTNCNIQNHTQSHLELGHKSYLIPNIPKKMAKENLKKPPVVSISSYEKPINRGNTRKPKN